jgi:hypothetical protein
MKELTCREFDEAVHEFVRMELLDVNKRDAVAEHAAHCALCAERMADAAALAEASETMEGRVREVQAPPQLEAALLAEFRNHHRRALWRRTLEWAAVGAAAAVLLVFLWTASGRSKGHSSPVPRKDVSSQSNGPVEANAGVRAKPEETTAPADAEDAGLPTTDSYVASDFVPIPFTGGISSEDSGMIVRVQLTRASLAQLGYPVAEAPEGDLIRADVLVGEDGWPRGVKLVQ